LFLPSKENYREVITLNVVGEICLRLLILQQRR